MLQANTMYPLDDSSPHREKSRLKMGVCSKLIID